VTRFMATQGGRGWRIAARAVLGVGLLITALGVLLAVAAWTEDIQIDRHTGYANAAVVSVTADRTLVRFRTPDGAERIPQLGVLYPEALEEGQLIRVEYDTRNPELVRVAGRDASLTLLPVTTTVLATWAVVVPVLLWLRRASRTYVTLE
jgi:hypothetical protein